jgi:cyclophilin family peptidyl-prolyl cis-trans isomerase
LAPHLDGKYVVFAEVVSGFDVLLEVNALADPERLKAVAAGEAGAAAGGVGSGGSGGTLKEAVIRDAGVIDELEGREQHASSTRAVSELNNVELAI